MMAWYTRPNIAHISSKRGYIQKMKEILRNIAKKSPALYNFLRYEKQKAEHVRLVRETNYSGEIGSILNNLNFKPSFTKEKHPIGSLIEITNTCNLNCIMCNTNNSKRPAGFMTPEVFERILKELNTVGVNLVGLHTVGEPFMHKGLEGLLKIAEKNGFNVWLSTNGQFPERIQELCRKVPSTANDYRFSIDGATPQTYEFIRKGATFEKLIKSLEVINGINGGVINRRVAVQINSVLSMTNIYEVPLYFEVFGKYCWPEDIRFNIINGHSPDSTFFKNAFPFPNLIRRNVPCHTPFRFVYFTCDGRVSLCDGDYEAEIVAGDIKENTLMEIWDSATAENVRRAHSDPKNATNLPCEDCYMPYREISTIVNLYIHYLMAKRPVLAPREFGDTIVGLLNAMNSTILEKDPDLFKRSVSNVFSR